MLILQVVLSVIQNYIVIIVLIITINMENKNQFAKSKKNFRLLL